MIVEIKSVKYLFDWNRLWAFNREAHNPDSYRDMQGSQSFSATDF